MASDHDKADKLLDKSDIYKSEDKIYTDPKEVLEALREGAKKMLQEHLEKAQKMEKGDTSPIPPDDVGMPTDPGLAKAQAMPGMGQNKNPGMPRGNYTGKTSIMKPEGAPKALKPASAPKPLKPPMPPKPQMAKGELFGINRHLGPNDTPETHDLVHHVVDRHTGQKVGSFKNKVRARNAADKKNNEYGGYRHEVVSEKVPKMAKGELLQFPNTHAAKKPESAVHGKDGVPEYHKLKDFFERKDEGRMHITPHSKIVDARPEMNGPKSKEPDRIDRIMGDMRADRARKHRSAEPTTNSESKKAHKAPSMSLEKDELNLNDHLKASQHALHLSNKAGDKLGKEGSKEAHLAASKAHDHAAKVLLEAKKEVEARRHAKLAKLHDELASFHKSEEKTMEKKEVGASGDPTPDFKESTKPSSTGYTQKFHSKHGSYTVTHTPSHLKPYGVLAHSATKLKDKGEHGHEDLGHFYSEKEAHKAMFAHHDKFSAGLKKTEEDMLEELVKDEVTKNMRPKPLTGQEKTVISKPAPKKLPSPHENYGKQIGYDPDKTVVEGTVSMRKEEESPDKKNPIKKMKDAVKEMKSNVEKLPAKDKKGVSLQKDEISSARLKAPSGKVKKPSAEGDPSWNKKWTVTHETNHGTYHTSGSMKPEYGHISVQYSPKGGGNVQHLGPFHTKEHAEKTRLEHHDRMMAGFKKSETLAKDEVRPHLGGRDLHSKMMTSQALDQAHKDAKAPMATKQVILPSQKDHAARAQNYADMMPQGHFSKEQLGKCAFCKSEEHDGMC